MLINFACGVLNYFFNPHSYKVSQLITSNYRVFMAPLRFLVFKFHHSSCGKIPRRFFLNSADVLMKEINIKENINFLELRNFYLFSSIFAMAMLSCVFLFMDTVITNKLFLFNVYSLINKFFALWTHFYVQIFYKVHCGIKKPF